MGAIVDIYSSNSIDLQKFLTSFFGKAFKIEEETMNTQKCEIIYNNPIYCADIISSYIENEDKFKINIWVSFDKNLFVNVTKHNADKIIRYLFERYPY